MTKDDTYSFTVLPLTNIYWSDKTTKNGISFSSSMHNLGYTFVRYYSENGKGRDNFGELNVDEKMILN
jgi:hypothetical protein